ncbi:hypothetical protein ACTQV6_04275 [Holdemanella porci]|uniref:hypothetical protein n=1 Tax=Holdemanella porci TaxID=2652276 RepID=UPI003F8FA473
MNKYQKAIEVIDTLLHLMCGEEREDGYKPTMEEMSNSMDLLKELVDKETPKKPIDIVIGLCGDLMLCCPTCKHGVVPSPTYHGNRYYSRCPFCGQKLEGENEDDC